MFTLYPVRGSDFAGQLPSGPQDGTQDWEFGPRFPPLLERSPVPSEGVSESAALTVTTNNPLLSHSEFPHRTFFSPTHGLGQYFLCT